MEKKIVDLHVHSSASDGTFSPTALMEEAKKAGLCAMALTDHDTTAGVKAAQAAADGLGIELIPGVELSTEYEGKEIHVVGLDIDIDNPSMQEHMRIFRESRDNRNGKMLANLRAEGFSITEEELKERYPDAVITRAHIARFLADTGQIPEMKVAFERYIGDDGICYVPRPKVTPMDAVDMIVAAKGIPVLAHPVLYHLDNVKLRKLIKELKAHGLVALEAIYSENMSGDEQYYKALAREEELLISGGSDFHGTNKPQIKLGTGRGSLYIPYDVWAKLKEKSKKNT